MEPFPQKKASEWDELKLSESDSLTGEDLPPLSGGEGGARRRLTGVGIFIVLFFTLVVFYLFFFGPSNEKSFSVSEIHVEGNSYLAKEEVLLLSGLAGASRLYPNDLKTSFAALTRHPVVTFVEFKRSGEGLTIVVHERKCFAVVRDGNSGELYEVDSSLHILSSGRGIRCSGVPIVNANISKSEDNLVSLELQSLFDSWKTLEEMYPDLPERISEIHLKQNGSVTLFTAGSRIKIELGKRLDTLLIRRLYASIAYLDREKYASGLLDLRGIDGLFLP